MAPKARNTKRGRSDGGSKASAPAKKPRTTRAAAARSSHAIATTEKPWRNIFYLPHKLKVQVASHVSAVFANL